MGSGDAAVRSVTRGVRWSCALAVAAAVALMSSGCSDNDIVTNSYATLAEARDAGAAGGGDLPVGVPEGAHDIRTATDLDSGRRWGLFSFLAQDAETLRAMLTTEEISLAGVECDIPGRIEWWPLLLRGTVNRRPGESCRPPGVPIATGWPRRRRQLEAGESVLLEILKAEQGYRRMGMHQSPEAFDVGSAMVTDATSRIAVRHTSALP